MVIKAKKMTDRTSKKKLGYDLVDSSAPHRRRSPGVNKGEDLQMDLTKRSRMIETARDGQRNFSLLKFLVTKHLDYTCSWQLRIRTGDRKFDREAERAFDRWSRSCDVSGRHPFRRLVRLHRSGQLVDGDALMLKVVGGRLQIFEADRIAKPGDLPSQYEKSVNRLGLVLDQYGKAQKYCLCKRTAEGLSFSLLADAENCRFDGFFSRYDQTRGISPLSSALMQAEDLYEALNFNLIKAKLAALFGLKITRKSSGRPGFDYGGPEGDGTGDETTPKVRKQYDIQARPGFVLDMEPDDDINLVASNTPSTEFQQFTIAECRLIMATLGMPYSMFDSTGCSYSSLRGDYQQYLSRVIDERLDIRETLYDISDWNLPILVSRGDIRLPSGITESDLIENYEWIPSVSAQLDPSKEVVTSALAIQSGLSSYSAECARLNMGDYYDIIDQLADEREYAKAKGVDLPTVPFNVRVLSDIGAGGADPTQQGA